MVVVVVEKHQNTAAAEPSEGQHPQSKRSSTTTTRGEEFANVVAPLEAATGVPLFNPQRSWCFTEFMKDPDAVRNLAHEVLREPSLRNPLGVFVWRLKKGWHLPVDAAGDIRGRIDASLRSAASTPGG